MSLPADLPENPVRRAPRQSRSRRMVERVLRACAQELCERGLGGMNTNGVAERAGISVGSIYQYFPDKAALVQALRAQHAQAMAQACEDLWQDTAPATLHEAVQALVKGLFAAHALAPALHAVLEQVAPFFVLPQPGHEAAQALDGEACDHTVYLRLRRTLAAHRDELVLADLDLAAWVALTLADSLAHAAQAQAVPFAQAALVGAATQAVWGYLTGDMVSPLRQRAAQLSRAARQADEAWG